MRNINIITIGLLAYLLIMSYIGWPGRNETLSYTEYFSVISATVVVIFLLRFLRIKLLKIREKRKKENRS